MKINADVLIAPDKFKGSLSALQAARALRRGVEKEIEIRHLWIRPIADGGEGSLQALAELDRSLQRKEILLPNSSGKNITAAYLIRKSQKTIQVFLESAAVVGLKLPRAAQIPVIKRSTYGIGLWMDKMTGLARRQKAERLELHIFLGGSATCDGGFGLSRALGFQYLDNQGRAVMEFSRIREAARIVFPAGHAELKIFTNLYTDVQSPLTGARGAARLFAPQKGASAAEVEILEKNIQALRRLLQKESRSRKTVPGAAGGMALPLVFWPGSRTEMHSGVSFFLSKSGIEKILRTRRKIPGGLFVLSGEGCTDAGTLEGKAVMGIFQLCKKFKTGLWVVSGKIRDRKKLEKTGMRLFSTEDICGPYNGRGAAARLEKTALAAAEIFAYEAAAAKKI